MVLSPEDWAEIHYALASKVAAIENGEYQPCMEHGDEWTSCDQAWMEHLTQILDAIGPDGEAAAERGVCGGAL